MSSQRKTITPAGRLQLLGVLTLAVDLNRQLRALESVALGITMETNRDGKRLKTYDGGHTGDAIYTTDAPDVDGLLDRIGLSVDHDFREIDEDDADA